MDLVELQQTSLDNRKVLNTCFNCLSGCLWTSPALALAGALSASLHLGVIKIGAPRQYDLAQAADAHRDLEARRTTGALVLGAISNTTDVP